MRTIPEFFRFFDEITDPSLFELEETDDGCMYFRYKGSVLMRWYPDTTYFLLYGCVPCELTQRLMKAAHNEGIPFRYVPTRG